MKVGFNTVLRQKHQSLLWKATGGLLEVWISSGLSSGKILGNAVQTDVSTKSGAEDMRAVRSGVRCVRTANGWKSQTVGVISFPLDLYVFQKMRSCFV